MTRRFLTQTRSAGTRSLTVGRYQVQDNWDQISAYLTSVLSPAHAAVFAEPFRGAGGITWMAQADSDAVPLTRLDPAEQRAAQERLGSLLGDIRALSEEKSASPRAADREWGALLAAISEQPGGIPLQDRIFVADGQPVLIQWGSRDDSTVSTEELLRDRLAADPPRQIQRPGPADPAAPAAALAATAPGWPLAWLLWLLFLLTLAAIYLWLLLACALHMPPGVPLVSACELRAAAQAAQDRHASLLQTLRERRADLGTAPPCAIAQAAAPEAADPPGPAEDAVPAPQDEAESDIDRAREQAGGELGDVTVTLIWSGLSDLDLIIRCPDGAELAGANSAQQGASCGGQIDIDANLCRERPNPMGSPCRIYARDPVSNPVENALFNRGAGPHGTFTVLVRHYAAAAAAPAAAIPYVVQLRRGDDRQRFEGVAQPGQVDTITSFVMD